MVQVLRSVKEIRIFEDQTGFLFFLLLTFDGGFKVCEGFQRWFEV